MKIFVEKPIEIKSNQIFDGKNQVFTGAKTLRGVRTQNGVCVCDLTANGVVPSKMRSRGFQRAFGGGHSELFINDKPCNVSRYPTNGWLTISGYKTETVNVFSEVVGDMREGFFYEDDTPKAWSENSEIWIRGYWCYDWASSCERIDVWDKEKGYIKTAAPYGLYGYQKGQRFCFLNAKEGVKNAGDYAIDYADNTLCFLPYDKKDDQEVSISVTATPCIHLENQSNIVVKNCVIQGFVGDGIRINNCKNIRFENCKIYNVGGRGAFVTNSENIVFENCEIFHVGDMGIEMTGGDRATLTPCNNVIRGCSIHDCTVWCRTYAPAIHFIGVGVVIEGNTLYDCPHTAIWFYGNEIKVRENVVYNVLYETGDAGAIYTGRDYTCRGNEISDNLICLTGGFGYGTMGIYNDDCMSGTTMERNVFYKVQRGILLGGGVDLTAKDNVFISCDKATVWDMRGTFETANWRRIMRILKEHFYNVADDDTGNSELYLSRYPELQKISKAFKNAEDLPIIPPSGSVEGSVYYDTEITVSNEAQPDKQDITEYFGYENCITVASMEELRQKITPLQYAKYLKALEIEREREKLKQ